MVARSSSAERHDHDFDRLGVVMSRQATLGGGWSVEVVVREMLCLLDVVPHWDIHYCVGLTPVGTGRTPSLVLR